jgi:hypothetical protein
MGFDRSNLDKVLFLDIETVRQAKVITDLDERGQDLFKKKFHKQIEETLKITPVAFEDSVAIEHVYRTQAPLMPEFGKIICISFGLIKEGTLKIYSYYGIDEKVILNKFFNLLVTYGIEFLVGHNIKGFDSPYTSIRFLANGLSLPRIFQTMDLKPWEMPFKDTQLMWQFGARYWSSLDLVAYTLGIPSPKETMTGADVGNYYWSDTPIYVEGDIEPLPMEARLKKIGFYCEGDVETGGRAFCKMYGIEINSVTRSITI